MIALSACFDGACAVFIVPLVWLWGFYRKAVERFPSPDEIRTAKSRVGYWHIDIRGNEVRL